jgi:HEAT repeat protein
MATDPALSADDWRVRGAAVQALSQSATADDLGRLIESLQHGHEELNVLSSVLQALATAPGDVLPPLVELLRDRSPNLRMHAALVLGHLNRSGAGPALVRALQDEDANVRFHAIEALGQLRAADAAAPLARIASSGDFFLAFPAIDALGRIGDPAALPALLDLLADDMLRPAAVDALGALAHAGAVGPLVQRLNAGEADATAVANALERIHERAPAGDEGRLRVIEACRESIDAAGLAHLNQALAGCEAPLRPLVVVLGWTGLPALPALAAALGDPRAEPGAQVAIANAIGAVGKPAVESILERMRSGERDARVAAAALLGRLGDRRAVPALIDMLCAADEGLVTAAAGALAALQDAAAVQPLLPLFSAASAPVRHAAIAALIAIDAPGTEALVVARLADADWHVRECAVRMMASSRFDAAAEGVFRALEDPHEEVRRAAITGLASVDHGDAAGRLLAALRDETPRNRAAAAHALRSVGPGAAAGAGAEGRLIAALGDPDPWVRYFAADSLVAHGRTAAIEALTALVARDPATHVRIASLRTIGMLDGPTASRMAAAYVAAEDTDLAAAAVAIAGPAAGVSATAPPGGGS